ncbi:MAG: tRNA (N(6)-L-threonylcarbamoyladenosine(37)-C(2))-methylthiotransferase MtaB [Clostridiales Family XIII bacterium]|jgi:threonylcarbamoyladenosine tRNA methylthiotransferase MtaB|nr:tRNA (N(6)-L-threonylcarbamoyladenosine(37)-C(2))-methylthiotransferase MtaB [Clostridiales Family XIII bacterium]
MKIAFYTLGCKVNQYETQALSERFAALGFEVVGTEEKADVYVVNSCTVTGIADRKSRKLARRSKRMSPDALTVLTGCYAEVGADDLKGVEEIDMVVGNGDKESLPELIADAVGARGGSSSASACAAPGDRDLPDGVTGLADRARAYIKIEDGCDRSCSYCIVPAARGKVRSRELSDIQAEARALVANGYKEIVLTGVNAALYGGAGGRGIIDAVDAVSKIGGDFRVRLSSLEPTVIDAAYAAELIKREILCPHLHLSLQSGSDAVLSAMNRGYAMRGYLRIAEVLKRHDPLFSITTDIIAGFPGETEADHEASMKAINDVGFSRIHVFRYSRRPGTPAAGMPGQIPSKLKAERSRALIAEGEKSANLFLNKNTGTRRRTLFYGSDGSGMYRGVTDNGIEVRQKSAEDISNEFRDIRLDSLYI